MARKKVQKNFNLPRDVAGWVEEMERTTGVGRGRIGIAAILGFILQTREAQGKCLDAATGIDLGDLSFDEVLANLRLVWPGVVVSCGIVEEYMRRDYFPPHGRITPEMIERAWAAQGGTEYEEQHLPDLDREMQEEVAYARRRWEAAEERLKVAGRYREHLEDKPVAVTQLAGGPASSAAKKVQKVLKGRRKKRAQQARE